MIAAASGADRKIDRAVAVEPTATATLEARIEAVIACKIALLLFLFRLPALFLCGKQLRCTDARVEAVVVGRMCDMSAPHDEDGVGTLESADGDYDLLGVAMLGDEGVHQLLRWELVRAGLTAVASEPTKIAAVLIHLNLQKKPEIRRARRSRYESCWPYISTNWLFCQGI